MSFEGSRMNVKETFSHKNKPFLQRLSFALHGLKRIWRQESSFRFQSYCAFALFVFCLFVRPSATWCAVFTLSVALVLSLECVNTVMEALLDEIHPAHSPLIGFVKDGLAAAVLIASFGSLVIFALYIFGRFT